MNASHGPTPPLAGNPRAITERSPVTVTLLGLVTCGIYIIVWGYQTTEEIRLATGDESIKPGRDLLLSFVTCGVWLVFTHYRNAKKIHELGQQLGLKRNDQSTTAVLVDMFAMPFTPALLQAEYNEVAKAAKALGTS
jgi:hypothetical protein